MISKEDIISTLYERNQSNGAFILDTEEFSKWKKQKSNTSGYVVKYSTNSKMKKAKTMYVSGNKKTKKSISGLKKGKKYYVQLATYKSVKGTKVISKYSKTKTVKVK